MKNIIILLSFMLSNKAFSQSYLPFIQKDKQWKIWHHCDGLCTTMDVETKYYFNGDTIINSEIYQKLYGKILYYNPVIWGVQDSNYLAALLREDTNERKVYIFYGLDIYSTYSIFNTEKILFDFSMEVGDTLNSYSSWYPDSAIRYIVTKIDTSTLLNGDTFLRFYHNNYSIFQEEFLGGEIIRVDPRWVNAIYDPHIRCVLNNHTHLYGNDCSEMKIQKPGNAFQNNFSIAMQTVSKDLIVESGLHHAVISIIGISGVSIITKDLHFGSNIINLSHLSNGMYFYIISSENKKTSGKFVKM